MYITYIYIYIHLLHTSKDHSTKIHGDPCHMLHTFVFNLPANQSSISIIWGFPKIVVPQNGWFIMEHPIKMDDLGGKPTIFGKDPASKKEPHLLNSILLMDSESGKTWPLVCVTDFWRDSSVVGCKNVVKSNGSKEMVGKK